jgi:hypothetical protein
MTKLKINLKEGSLEVEGEETFVTTIYNDFKEQLAQGTPAGADDVDSQRIGRPAPSTQPNNDKRESANKPKVRSSTSKPMPTMLKDLDLRATADHPGLREFYAEKAPSSAMETNAVFVYHLKNNLGLTGITVDHIYTCYKDVGAKPPSALRQSLIDTANRKAWIDTSTLEDITLSLRGESFVDHDLPKIVKK